MSGYTPPLPGHGPLSFIGPYTAPLPGHGPLSFGSEVSGQALSPIGIYDGALGQPGVTGPKTLLAQSIGNTLGMGVPNLKFGQFFIKPGGYVTQAFGTAKLENKQRFVGAVGFNATLFGTDWVSYFLRQLTPTGIKQDGYGTATLAGGVRLALMNGFATAVYGRPTVTLAVREVFPQWFVDTRYGTPMMGYDRTLTGQGFDATKWGDGLVWDNTQRPGALGFDASRFGTAWADRRVRSLLVKPFPDGDLQNIGFPKLHNLNQFITANYVQSQWDEGGFGSPIEMHVYNVNRKIDLVGNGIAPPFRQIPLTHAIVNGARTLKAKGLDATLWGVKTASDGMFIAYRVRSVYPQGFQPAELSSRFHIVRNAAAQLKPVGFDSARLGVPPLVVNTRRYFSGIRVGLTDGYGLPFIAPRVRTVGPQNPLDPVRGIIGGATIWFRERTITPTPPPFGWGAFGKLALDVHWNIVAAKSIPPSWRWGYGAVRNNTPEITPYWDSSLFTQFGRTAIFNKLNWYAIEGWQAGLWGPNTIITYRTKKITPAGFDGARYNPKHTIRNVNPDPPGQQYVYGASLGALGGVGTPYATNNGLYPVGIFDDHYGSPKVQGMSIFPQGIPPFIGDNGTAFGTPSIPGRQGAQNATLGLIDGYGKPRLDPYTIWAPKGAPQQAIDNHGGVIGEIIDAYLDRNTDVRPLFGRPRVELKNRRVTHYFSGPLDSYGQPRLSRKPQYAVVAGMKFTKYGFPVLFGGDRAVLAAGFDLSSYGTPSLTIPEPFIRYLRPAGPVFSAFGATWVANFIRYPGVTGFNATAFGTTWVQRPPPPAYPPGLDASRWGTAMIAYRIRHLTLDGMDTFVCDYTLGRFRDRMRLHGRNRPMNVSLGVQSIMGVPSLDAKLRALYLRAIVPASGSFPTPVVRKQNRVNLVSLGAQTAWGEPWALAVQPGTVQPRGEDFSTLGRPQASYQVFLDGWMGELGAARVGWPIGAAGADTSQFGEMVLMGFGCGRQARAMHGWDSFTAGTASVG